ncbi:unnamed protein product [Rhizophagus irregularis]|nr:unnamed protein product [Rhizophagus irregularis]
MINSAMSLRNPRNRSIDPFHYYQKNNAATIDKRKFDDSVEGGNDNDQNSKRRKLFGNENSALSDYFTKEIELDINKNLNQSQNNGYVTREFGIDINNITSRDGEVPNRAGSGSVLNRTGTGSEV